MSNTVCLRCMFTKHRENALRKAEEWTSVPALANPYKTRAEQLANEIEATPCTCDRLSTRSGA